MWTAKDLASQIDPLLQQFRGMVRRAAITLTSVAARWQVTGFRQADGKLETKQAEVYPGIGFYSRPPSSGAPEAIVNMVGADARTPVIVATRDEKTRAAVVGNLAVPPPGGVIVGGTTQATNLAEDETIEFNSKAFVYIKADGTIEARSVGGAPQTLATKDDLDVLRAAINTAAIALGVGGAATIVTAADATLAARTPPTGPWPNGTKKFSAE